MTTQTTDIRNWRTALKYQGETLRWLAEATGTKPRTVYAYAAYAKDPSLPNARRPSDAWLARVRRVLEEEVSR
jgi:hypothetical protein